MSVIQIISNGIEIDFVKETLTLKKENNALSRDFRVAHSTVPFLVIENKNTKLTLGTRELTSINKQKVVPVTVIELGVKYTGEIQIISYLNGFRKCNLKYATDLLPIMNTKIADFLPITSVVPGETTPDTWVEEANEEFLQDGYWVDYVQDFLGQIFPAVKWQFPTLNFKNKFGENPEATDPWFEYQQKINAYVDDVFVMNTFEYDSGADTYTVSNKSVAAPQLFLLTPLHYALASVGYTYDGDFVTSNFIKRILMLSVKSNLTKINLLTTQFTVDFDGAWENRSIGSYPAFFKREIYTIPFDGDYTIDCNFVLAAQTSTVNASYYSMAVVRRYRFNTVTSTWYEFNNEIIFKRKNNTPGEVIDGDFDMYFRAGDKIYFDYVSINQIMPTSYVLKYRKANEDKEFYQMHPTINVGRFAPDWTFVTYLNELKNLFNLEIKIDDFKKVVSINFNDPFISGSEKTIIQKSLKITSYEQTPNNAYLLKFQNSEDTALWITSQGEEVFTNQKSDFSNTLQSKFKWVPVGNTTADLSDAVESKEGVGLMLYDETNSQFVADNYQGQTLSIDGTKGIYETYWRKWLKFLLNGSVLELSGPFTETELAKLIATNRAVIDLQDYVIEYVSYAETKQGNFNIKFKVISVTF